MEEIINLVANYSLLIVISGLFIWDWLSNKKKTSELESQNNAILLQNSKCLEEMSKSNENISKTLEILKTNIEKTATTVEETSKNVLIIKNEIERKK